MTVFITKWFYNDVLRGLKPAVSL